MLYNKFSKEMFYRRQICMNSSQNPIKTQIFKAKNLLSYNKRKYIKNYLKNNNFCTNHRKSLMNWHLIMTSVDGSALKLIIFIVDLFYLTFTLIDVMYKLVDGILLWELMRNGLEGTFLRIPGLLNFFRRHP